MSLNLKEGQKVVVVDYVTKKLVTRGVVTDIGASSNFPIGVKIDEPFVVGSPSRDALSFFTGERLTFNGEYLYRGHCHEDHKKWDLEVLSEEYYNKIYFGKTSTTYQYLMDSFSREAVKVSEEVDKAVELLIPHIKSGRLSVEIVKGILEAKL